MSFGGIYVYFLLYFLSKAIRIYKKIADFRVRGAG